MTIQRKENHVKEVERNLLTQFQGSNKLIALLSVFAGQVQHLEDVLFELLIKRTLDDATGIQLDKFGQIVGLERKDRDDDSYRIRLRAQIRINLSRGTPEDIITVVGTVIGDQPIQVIESSPAHFDVIIGDPLEVDGYEISALVQSAKPAGVRGIFQWRDHRQPFTFDEDSDGLGFDEGAFTGAADT